MDDNAGSRFVEDWLDKALEGLGIGVSIVDKHTGTSSHNALFRQLLNIPPRVTDSGDDKALLNHLSHYALDPGASLDSLGALADHPELRLSTKLTCDDGRVLALVSLPIMEGDQAIGSIWCFQDVTEAERLKQSLRIEVGFRNAIVQALPDLAWLKDSDGVYLACNGRFQEFFGAPEAEILGKTDYDFVDRELADFCRENHRNGIEKGAPSVNDEWIRCASDSHPELLETSKTPMFDEQGTLIGVLGIGRDTTERRAAEDFAKRNTEILEMIASGEPAARIYDEIALMYEARHPGMRCSMLELDNGTLLHGGAPSLPKAYRDAVHGLKNGPNVGSCGTSTFTGRRVLVEDIATDPKWAKLKDVALAHGLRCCWSEPIKNSSGDVLGAFGMYYGYPALPTEEESNDLRSAARLAGIVMERDQSQKRIRQLAFFDNLTGLASRANLYQHLEALVEGSNRAKGAFGVLYVDLDDFKDINDSLGHDAGDALLREIGDRLRKVSRASDLVARLGGDEFCVVVEDIDDDFSVGAVALRCLDVIKQPFELSGRKISPACSIGIALFPNDSGDVAGLLKAADTSLYSAKESGKNRYAFYMPEFTEKAEQRFRVEHHLRSSLVDQQLHLVYQPQVDLTTNRIVGVEALARWHHAQLGKVPPSEFIPISERIGEIEAVTRWVLGTACRQAVAWSASGIEPMRMAVNVSPMLFLDTTLVDMVEQVIDETGMDPSRLQLEVTDNVVQTDPDNLHTFRRIKDIGVLIALDDFGAGYSSFKSLKHLAIDCLKIDRYFINDMVLDHGSQLLARSMIELGERLGHEVVAEGVETDEQLTALRRFGCATAQGYLFSGPLDAAKATELLAQATHLYGSTES